MEKKYKLNIKIRKGLEERDFDTLDINTTNFVEHCRLKEFAIFDKEAYLVYSLEEINNEDSTPLIK